MRRWIGLALVALAWGGSASPGGASPAADAGAQPPTTVAPTHGAVAVLKLDGTSGFGSAPDIERFDGSGSYSLDPKATIVAWAWDFGDGRTASGAKTSHTFTGTGVLTVTLTVTDSDGAQASATTRVSVNTASSPGVVAVAQFEGSSGSGPAPLEVAFDGSQSHATDWNVSIASCAWDFGDGQRAGGCRTTHTFLNVGTFQVTLTVMGTRGATATATLEVEATAPPPGSTRWARSAPTLYPELGSDFSSNVVMTYGNTLEGIDPASGSTLWRQAYEADSPTESFAFMWPPSISPADGSILAHDVVNDSNSWVLESDCAYSPTGAARGCFASMSTSTGGMFGAGMGAAGDSVVAARVSGGTVLYGRRADGSAWSVALSAPDWQPPGFEVAAVTAEPGGDAIVSGSVGQGYVFDGHAIPEGGVLMRITPEGHLVWWQSTFVRRELGTSARGTIVVYAETSQTFQFGNRTLGPGAYLLVNEADGTPRWAQPLPESGGWQQMAVLPAGQVAIAIDRADYSGLVVYRYDLAGDLLWKRDFAGTGTDIWSYTLTILPHDVLIGGSLGSAADLGTGTLPAGGFLMDLNG
jgi:chitodextrinase